MPSKLQHLINTIFALTCIIHVSLIVYNNLFPEFPERKISKHQLNEIEFPLEFLLCANQFKDEAKRYRNVGYLDNGAFFQGKIDGKKSIGWGGQHQNGFSYGSVEGRIRFVIFITFVFSFQGVLRALRLDWDKKLQKIYVSSKPPNNSYSKEVKGSDMNWNLVPSYPFCQSVDLKDYFDLKKTTPNQIIFYFEKIKSFGIFLYIIARDRALRRRLLKPNMLSYNGPELRLNNLHDDRKVVKVALRLSQFIYSDKDENNECVNYPQENYQSYRACDEDYIYRRMKNHYGIMPFWATGNLSEVTKARQFHNLYWLI